MPLSSIYPQAGFRTPLNPYQPQQIQGMSLNMPIGVLPQQPSSPSNTMVGVHGLDSAKQYPTKPGDTIPLFSMDSDHAFIVNADANNVVSIKILKFSIISEEEYRKEISPPSPEYITKDEYEDLKKRFDSLEEELSNAKQFIREHDNSNGSISTSTKPTSKSATSIND